MTMTPLRRRGAALAAALLSATLVLTACGSDSDDPANTASETRQFEADNGTIEIPVDPQRVVTLGSSTSAYLDVGGEPVGVQAVLPHLLEALPEEHQAAYEAAEIVGDASTAADPDFEKIASLSPDLILYSAPDIDWTKNGERLQSIAPTVWYDFHDDWKPPIDGFADAGGRIDELNERKEAFSQQLADINSAYSEIIADEQFVNVERWASTEAGQFRISLIGCAKIAKEDVGLNLPDRGADGSSSWGYSFEQLGELSTYDVILYPIDDTGQPTEPFAPVAESNSWKALPAVESGNAVGVTCPGGNGSYGFALQYLDSLESALAKLPPRS